MMRTSWCGQVRGEKLSVSAASATKPGSSPSAPPMTKAAAALPSSRQRAIQGGEGPGGDRLAALVEGDRHGGRRQGGTQGAGFLGLAARGAAGAGFGEFGDLEAGEAERLAGADGTLQIARHQLALRPLLHAADGVDGNTHEASVLAASVGCAWSVGAGGSSP